ncbi:MAG: hypothetical protein ACTSRW_12990 [Candidatus Helarchaeota archaeon]
MLKYFLCFRTHGGDLLISRSYGFQERDPVIISGLLAAFGDLAEELGGSIKSINMFNHRILISIIHKIAFTVFIDENDDEEQAKYLLELFKDCFFALHGNLIGQEGVAIDLTQFEDLNSFLDQLPYIKLVHETIEKSSKPLSVSEVKETMKSVFDQPPPTVLIWMILRDLSKNDQIVQIDDSERGVLFRKKGELLKGLPFKIS